MGWLKSPFRFVVQPIIDHVLQIERNNPDRTIAVLLPELVERQWYQYFLHNQRARILAARLRTQGTHRIVIVNVPWYLTQTPVKAASKPRQRGTTRTVSAESSSSPTLSGYRRRWTKAMPRQPLI
jgi:hypothetical protein